MSQLFAHGIKAPAIWRKPGNNRESGSKLRNPKRRALLKIHSYGGVARSDCGCEASAWVCSSVQDP